MTESSRAHIFAYNLLQEVLASSEERFKRWMSEVDEIVWHEFGCSVHDLPDYDLRDWFNDKTTPHEAVSKICEKEGMLPISTRRNVNDY